MLNQNAYEHDAYVYAKLGINYGQNELCRCPTVTPHDKSLWFTVREIQETAIMCPWDLEDLGYGFKHVSEVQAELRAEFKEQAFKRNEYLRKIGSDVLECVIPDEFISKFV